MSKSLRARLLTGEESWAQDARAAGPDPGDPRTKVTGGLATCYPRQASLGLPYVFPERHTIPPMNIARIFNWIHFLIIYLFYGYFNEAV